MWPFFVDKNMINEYEDIYITLNYGESKSVAAKNVLITEPIMKKLNSKWVSASHDITMEYNEDFSVVKITNDSGCSTPLYLCLRAIKVFKL